VVSPDTTGRQYLENMDKKYDVIIIGAGIGGLTCGCYLAKAGLKVLIVEQNHTAGGYCTSFRRNGYFFDSSVHSLCSNRKNGRLRSLFEDFGVEKDLKLNRYNPTDVIVTPEFEISIFKDPEDTIGSFAKNFPQQRVCINNFIRFMVDTSIPNFLKVRGKSFKQLLNSYISDSRLQSLLSTLTFQLAGLPPEQLSAMAACLLWKEFILDGGYYPEGGIQEFPNLLVSIFEKLEGDLMLKQHVKKIVMKNNKLIGVKLNDDSVIRGAYIVSACDLKQTLFDLLEACKLTNFNPNKFKKLKVSSSGFLVYLGLDKYNNEFKKFKSNYYLINNYNFKTLFSDFLKNKYAHLSISSPSIKSDPSNREQKLSLCLASNATFGYEGRWNQAFRDGISDQFINLAKKIIPGLSDHILLRFNAAPTTLMKWTGNYKGAAYGWANTPEQYFNLAFNLFDNLFFVGHWSNQGSGTVSVINSGYKVAERILTKKRLNK
jgi:phytoene dehydrogenase-like protein